MDSGRKALLARAREFGALAQNWSWKDFLERSVTFRTLALYLGIQNEWWEEFWRSFSLEKAKVDQDKNLRSFRFCCRATDLPFLMMFLSKWFGGKKRISEIREEEFMQAYALGMKSD